MTAAAPPPQPSRKYNLRTSNNDDRSMKEDPAEDLGKRLVRFAERNGRQKPKFNEDGEMIIEHYDEDTDIDDLEEREIPEPDSEDSEEEMMVDEEERKKHKGFVVKGVEEDEVADDGDVESEFVPGDNERW
jgi:hypothetical protein